MSFSRGYPQYLPCFSLSLSLSLSSTVSIIISPVDTNVRNENDSLLVVCVGVGYPELSISWSHDGNPIENSTRITIYVEEHNLAGQLYIQSILEVCSVSVMDGGIYKCTATNGAENSSSNFTVTIGGKLVCDVLYQPSHLTSLFAFISSFGVIFLLTKAAMWLIIAASTVYRNAI